MNVNEIVWLSTFRSDTVRSIPAEFQEFFKKNVYHIATLCNLYYPNQRNNSSPGWVFNADCDSRNAVARSVTASKEITCVYIEKPPTAFSVTEARRQFRLQQDPKFLLPLLNIKEHKIGDTTYLTQLEPEFIRYLGDILDLSDLVDNTITVDSHFSSFDFKSGSNIEITLSTMQRHDCWVDNVGTIAILPEDLETKFKEKFATVEPIKVLKTASLYKGAAPYFGPDKQSITNVASGGRFFLYSTKIKILDNEIKEVPFIGLAVFGGEKLIKYKNSLSLINRLQDFSNSLKTQALLYPEKYKELVKSMVPPLAQYWPGLTKIIAEKHLSNKFTTIDANTIKYDHVDKFKAFFINSTLAKTSEASQYLALKNKHELMEKQNKELLTKVKVLQEQLESNRISITEDLANIQALKERIKNSQMFLETTTDDLNRSQPQAERAKNAAIEILTQLEPLEADYKAAISTYWNKDISLDTLNNWEEQGFIISSITLFDSVTNKPLDTPELIKDRMSKGNTSKIFISNMKIYTTKPTLIYKDGHKNREKAEKFAGGPYIITLSFNGVSVVTMSVRLLDDRSLRGVWSDGYYQYFCTHPHTQRYNYDLTNFKTNPQSAWSSSTTRECTPCMGELEPILVKAMKNMSLSEVLYGVRGWLETATSADGYGVNVQYFPLAKDVIFEKFTTPTIPEIPKLETIKPVFSKQSTYLKKTDDKFLATIFLTEDTKVLAYETEGEVKDNELKFKETNPSIMMFLSTNQRDTAMISTTDELKTNGYILFAEQKSVETTSFSFPYNENKPEVVEEYRPAGRRITQEVIRELQNLTTGEVDTPF